MKITFKNISQYIEGNTKMFMDYLGFQPQHIKEQIAYRMLICKDDCMKTGSCKYCSCDIPGKMFVKESCNNNERFPDLMNKVEWIKYKEENGIK